MIFSFHSKDLWNIWSDAPAVFIYKLEARQDCRRTGWEGGDERGAMRCMCSKYQVRENCPNFKHRQTKIWKLKGEYWRIIKHHIRHNWTDRNTECWDSDWKDQKTIEQKQQGDYKPFPKINKQENQEYNTVLQTFLISMQSRYFWPRH